MVARNCDARNLPMPWGLRHRGQCDTIWCRDKNARINMHLRAMFYLRQPQQLDAEGITLREDGPLLLPKPKSAAVVSRWDADSDDDDAGGRKLAAARSKGKSKASAPAGVLGGDDAASGAVVAPRRGPPPYGQRAGFVPRSLEDFGDGGAFPEIHMVQFPLDMGRKSGGGPAPTLSLQTDESGNIRYDLVLHQGQKKNSKKIVHSSLVAMKEQDVIEGDESLVRPDSDAVQETADRTKTALDKIIGNRISSGKDSGKDTKGPTFVRYTPADQSAAKSVSGAETRIIKMVEAPVDPLEPPRYKHKKVPRGPPSPPPPVMHSPPRKVSVQEQKDWVIPPCISNWKNAKGYTIPLDKRLANDGRGLQEVTINDNFAKLSEALFIADRHAREEVKLRAEMQSRLAEKEKREKEAKLRMLAQKAREERAGLVSGTGEAPSADQLIASTLAGLREAGSERDGDSDGGRSDDDDDDDGGSDAGRDGGAGSDDGESEDESDAHLTEEQRRQMRERNELRRSKQQQRVREMRMSHMGSETKARVLAQSSERDISEKIALGLAKPTMSKDTLFDQRLFNQSAGLSSGFGADDAYGLYDKPLFQGSSAAAIYRPKRVESEVAAGVHTDKIERLLGDQAPHKGFKGAEGGGPGASGSLRDGPVAFEKEADVFGFDDFMTAAKRGRGGDQQQDGDRGAAKRTRQ
ncbi:mRNA splicing protein [Polyrhizophydium stewartii]|uniref:Pre-mRNA-processing protein 45 n=1 Tax=Polyrhizophydium stewartii TaxID=2732419 RepID=A0ABR4N8K8_9FUNG